MKKLVLLICAAVASMALHADVSCSFNGTDMTVTAPSTYAGLRLTLLWDTADKGNDPAAWANSYEIAAVVPAGGERYTVSLSALGIANGTPCRIVVSERYKMLDMLKMDSTSCYIDTGFKDTAVYGVRFGFYGNSGNLSSGWNYILGSGEGSSDSARGLVVGQSSTSYDVWYWTYSGHRSGSDRPSANTDSINEAAFTNRTFTLNGNTIASNLASGSVGVLGLNIFLGRAQNHGSRYYYGWWSHVSFDDASGNRILDYIPMQRCSDDKVGFYDRVKDKFVTSTGGGDFGAGTVTNANFEVVQLTQRVTPNHAISLEASGTRLYANVPSGLAGEQIMLAWDDADKGSDIGAWANSHELAAVVGANGGTYCADLARLGVRNGQVCRVFAVHSLRLLDMLELSSTTAYIDTGFKDTAVYGVRFGFYGNSGYASAGWNYIMGSAEGDNDSARGFIVGQDGANFGSWFWTYTGYRSGTRPAVSNDSINEAVFASRTFTLNGSVVKSDLAAGSVGVKGLNIFLGRSQGSSSRCHYGWWSHVRFDDVDGNAILDYIPAQRTTDGKVGFYDRATGRFVTSTGGGAFNAGTVTNALLAVANSSASIVARGVPFLDVALNGMVLNVTAPSGLAGEQLLLMWDDSDKGGDLSAWAHSEVLAAALPTQGGTYSANLATLGIGRGHVCRVATVNQMELLDMLKMPNTSTYVNTGIPDGRCYGVRFGFFGNEGHTTNGGTFQNFIGTVESVVGGASSSGFTVGMSGAHFDQWYWIYRSYKSDSERPTVSTNSVNHVAFTNRMCVVNGVVMKSGLAAGAVGESGRNMYIGTMAELNRFLFGWWSYVRFDDAAGSAIIDYIPAKRTADGKVGFIDRASGAFILSTGGGDFTAGTVTNASCAVEHLWRAVSLEDVVVTATWTGGGASGHLDDPANWACTNLYGDAVSGLPGEYTAVTIPSADAFNCPAGSPFVCQTLFVNGTLTGDHDWRGLDFAVVSGTINLAGHSLQALVGVDMLRAATVTDTVGGGALHIEVPNGLVVSNTAVAFTGAFSLVKEGEGTFVAAKAGQTYSGGTDVAGGTFASGGNGTAGIYGAAGTTNTVFAGAVFDCHGHGEHWRNQFVLAGGTLRDPWRVAHITLTDDSFIEEPVSNAAIANEDFAEATLEMNGHTLTFYIEDGKSCALVNLTVTGGGTILQRTGGYLRLGYTGAEGVRASGTVLDIHRSIRADAASTFLDYVARYDGNWDFGPAIPIKVVRRFCPYGDSARWHSVELQDGAILDLSRVTGVWNATSQGAHFEGASTLSFAPNATITVDVGERTFALDDQLTSWSAKPANVTFVWSLQLPLRAMRSGLFASNVPGMVISIQ